MKTLIIVRHGKSSWSHDVADRDRPLKKRAYPDAEKVIEAFKPFYKTNTRVWSSDAVRARSTANLFKEELKVPINDFSIKEELYTFNMDTLWDIIASCPAGIENLMLFGHNPAVTEVVNLLGDQVFDNIPTTGLVQIEFLSDTWEDLGKGKTNLYLFPKHL